MQGPFDKTPRGEANIYQNWSIKLIALPLLLAIALIGYVVSHPGVAGWVAEGCRLNLPGSARCATWCRPRWWPGRPTSSAR